MQLCGLSMLTWLGSVEGIVVGLLLGWREGRLDGAELGELLGSCLR